MKLRVKYVADLLQILSGSNTKDKGQWPVADDDEAQMADS